MHTDSKRAFIDSLYYDVGKQSELKLAKVWTDEKTGEKKWSKHKDYLAAQADETFMAEVNNRTILPSEVVLDFDLKKEETAEQLKQRYEAALATLKAESYKYQAYFTGSRGYHIHLFFSSELPQLSPEIRKRVKEFFISKFGCDLQKAGSNVMIALENCPHWKTGQTKTLLEPNPGENSASKIISEYEQAVKARQEKEKPAKLNDSVESVRQAVDVIEQDILEMFADENEDTWAQYIDNESKQFFQIMSQPFEDFIRTRLNEMAGEPKENWVQPIMKLLDSTARRKEHRRLQLRSAELDGAWYIQLNRQQAAKIVPGQAEIVESPLIFRNFPHQQDRPADLEATPQDIHLLRKYVPKFATEQEYMTYIASLPAYLIPGISKPISESKGEPGSGKSTLCRTEQTIIDPSSSMNQGTEFPKNDGDWFALAREHSHVFIDNVNKLTPDQQDKLCRVITGTGVKKRKLYCDFATVQAQIKLSVSLNGIDFTDLQSDYLDRTLIWELKRIPDDEHKGESQFNKDFKADYPKIIGAILQILARARQEAEGISIPKSLRLSDFAKYATACAVAIGYKAEDYINLLQLKSQQQKDETISQSRIADPVFRFMENRSSYTGTAAELLKELSLQEFGKIVNTSGFESVELPKVLPEYWPKDPARFSKELRRIGFVLEALGLKIAFKAREGKSGRRPIEITKKESFGQNTDSTVSETPFIDDKSDTDSSPTVQNSSDSTVSDSSHKQIMADSMTVADSKQKNTGSSNLSSKAETLLTVLTVNSENKLSEKSDVTEELIEDA